MLKDDRRVTISLASGVQASYDGKTGQVYLQDLYSMLPMDGKQTEITVKRLRPEFLADYPHPLCADAFTSWSATSKRERAENDEEVMQACAFLREHWIPAFVRKLDQLEIRPINSHELTRAFHDGGVNIRYLGKVADLSNIAFIKEMSCIEMTSRAVKSIFRSRLRGAILHFKTVGATQIEDELNSYVASLFSLVLTCSEKNHRFFHEKLSPEIKRKFDYDMTFETFTALHRPAMMMSLQYHCGVSFENEMVTDFSSPKLLSFMPKMKFVHMNLSKRCKQLCQTGSVHLPKEEMMAFALARHFKSMGPSLKLSQSELSAKALIEVAAFYNAYGRYEEAKTYAMAASNAAHQSTCLQGLAIAQSIESACGLQSDFHAAPDSATLVSYKKALSFMDHHWGKGNLWTMALHDRLCAIYLRSKRPQQALEFLELSLVIATTHLGKHHPITAGYLVKSGVILRSIGQTQDAFQQLTEAMHIYQALQSDISLIAEAHYHLAEVLLEKGDQDGAVNHSQRCRKLRERCYGHQDPRTIESYRQVSRLLLFPYLDYKGVMTPQIKAAYREVIQTHEKVFRFLKNLRSSKPLQLQESDGKSHRRANSQMSVFSVAKSYRSSATHTLHTTNTLTILIPPLTGPYFTPPYAMTEMVTRQWMHKLAKQILILKLDLLEQPNHKECVRQLRLEISNDQTMKPEAARDVIFKMAAVSPSIYMDGLLARIDEEDQDAVNELAIVLQLVENEVLGLTE